MAATETKHRRGTEAENAAFTGAVGEWIYTTDGKRGYWHDGTTAGGIAVPTAFDLQKSTYIAADISGPDSTGEYSVTLTPTPAAYSEYMVILGTVVGASVGDDTLNVNGLGGKTIKKNGGADNLNAGDLSAGGTYLFVYDGTNIQLISGAGSGTWSVIERSTVTSVATVDFETGFGSGYKTIKIIGHFIKPASDNQNLWARLKVSGSYQTTGYHYGLNSREEGGAGDTQSAGGAQLLMTNATPFRISANDGGGFEFTISRPDETDHVKPCRWQVFADDDSGIFEASYGGGTYAGSAAAVTGVRFMFGSGNVAEIDAISIGIL